jgi:N-acetylglutamate synthase-like GNAT family acetyltransferase
LDAFRAELAVTEAYLSAAYVFVVETHGRIAGFAGFSPTGTAHELLYLFIDPPFIGNGFGAMLWQRAVEQARELGWDKFFIVSDPNAEAFYLKQGAIRVGERASSVSPERKLPMLDYRL